jgi:hypothetical protein
MHRTIFFLRNEMGTLSMFGRPIQCYAFRMTKLLKEAIEAIRQLPEEDQDAAAIAVFAYLTNSARQEADRDS